MFVHKSQICSENKSHFMKNGARVESYKEHTKKFKSDHCCSSIKQDQALASKGGSNLSKLWGH